MFPKIELDLDEAGTSSVEEQKLVDDYNPNYEKMETFGYGRDLQMYENLMTVQKRFQDRNIPKRSWMPLFLKYHVTARLCYDAKDSKNWNELMIKLFENYDFDTKEDEIRFLVHTFVMDTGHTVEKQLYSWVNFGREHHTLPLLFDAQRKRYTRFLKGHMIDKSVIDSSTKLENYDDLIEHITLYVPERPNYPVKSRIDHKNSSTSNEVDPGHHSKTLGFYHG
ncbi:hypothetical protein CANARDRAFT_21069 [[Candida] arabinofermentans NRRL YB-2248]|uniref:Uncharacterized protein n=1 Tax=[Candida] arabinofermentans NRRL YB-2248 TaxID=983967 RepID=A0A1E4T5Q9_9ASCO|nr:hypothetical protein CANARDRAFT_21069 [[Candida] arabinofermentans NRRL YB-2248]